MLLYHAGSIIGIDNAQKVHVIVGVEAHDVFVIDEGRLLRIHSPSQLPTNISISLAKSYATRRVVHDTHAVGLRITRKHNCHLPAMMLAVIVVSNLRYALHAQ